MIPALSILSTPRDPTSQLITLGALLAALGLCVFSILLAVRR